MGFNPPVPQQDSNLEIRIAVLLSLVFQIILIIAAPLRKRSSSAFFRFVIWSCYLLADWVADLALGLLLNNMGNIGGGGSVGSLATPSSIAGLKHAPHGDAATSASVGRGGGSSSPIIFAFWAPFLLLHLGGPDTITAYSLEDNELWLRHLIGFLFELSAATVVFFCSLRDNPMIVATPIMFIAGIIKYVERTYSLYYGSTDGFPVAILGVPDVRSTNISKLMQAYSSKHRAGLVVELATFTDNSNYLWERYVGKVAFVDELNAYDLFINFRAIFVNGVVSTRNRWISEAFYLSCDSMKAFHILEIELSYMYDMLFTKMPVLSSTVGYVLRFVGCCCIISSLIIFATHDRAGMLPADIGITYALLAIAVALEVVALVMLLFSNWTLVYIHHSQRSVWLSWLVRYIQKIKKYWRGQHHATWSGTIWQMNLIDHSCCTLQWDNHSSFFRRNVAKVVNKNLHKPIIRRIKKGEEKYKDILTFIFERIKEIVTESKESKQRKQACQARGDRALLKLKESFEIHKRNNIEGTIIFQSVSERDFDESLLLWHIATDLCLNMEGESTPHIKHMQKVSEGISEYLLYLLINKPEMTSATIGIGQLRYRNTCEEAKLLFRSVPNSSEQGTVNIDHKMACRMVQHMDTINGFIKGDRTKTVLFNASVLAKALRDSFTNQDAMWTVIAHVWMEMLTFTASHTQPREHLKKLSHGGELITMVWLLMAHMGMTSSSFEVQEAESINKLIIHDQ